MSDETTQNSPSPQTPDPTDSAPITMPSEAPEAPMDTVTPLPVKDDNLGQNLPESQISEPAQTAQIELKSEQTQALETTPETETAHLPPLEPLGELLEPNAPTVAPAPISAEPISQPVQSPQPRNLAKELFVKAREAIQFRKRKKLDRVMTLFVRRTNITNDEVEKLLHVSDATATRYLETLEKEGKIKQVGKTGKSVSYTKI